MCDDARVACVDVVIVAHNAGPLLSEAAASAAAQAGQTHVWVVDAASSDGSVGTAVRCTPTLHLIPVANDGFAAANNRGITATTAPFVLLLNPDALLLPGALHALLEAARARPRAAVIGPLVLDLDGKVQAGSFGRFPTLANVALTHLVAASRRLLKAGRGSLCAPRGLASVDWVTGAAMLVRREAVDDAGPMDEGFFLYYEDVEWCHRLRDHGWDVVLQPAALVAHHRGATTGVSPGVQEAYRASFNRYCDLQGLWGLKNVTRIVLPVRQCAGGRL
jgi:N-acetylglucosaminyl-diphospho-decaprenol L-rhamnosyltransferase